MVVQNNPRKIIEVQQDFAEHLGYEDSVIWDHISGDTPYHLKTKIKLAICDPPEVFGTKANEKRDAHIRELDELREAIFQAIWAQRKYTNNNLLMSIIYVCVTQEEYFPLLSTRFSLHPIFRTKKCEDLNGDSFHCCKIFVDEEARVYHSWNEFIATNSLPAGKMVAPINGNYSFDKNDKVRLMVSPTPKSTLLASTLEVADQGAFVAGVGSTVVTCAALASSVVAAPVAAGAAMIGAGVGIYTVTRQIFGLADRYQHEQPIDPSSDRKARSMWLGVLGGAFGFASGGATRYLTNAAQAGTATNAARTVANAANITSLCVNGTSCANEIYDIYLKSQETGSISLMDFYQLSTSLFLFTHSLNNFKLASTIVNDIQTSKIQSYRQNLTKNQKKRFNKLVNKKVRLSGESVGKTDIIRIINDRTNGDIKYSVNAQSDLKIKSNYSFTTVGLTVVAGAVTVFKIVQHLHKDVLARIHDEETFKEVVLEIMQDFTEECVKYIFKILDTFIRAKIIALETAVKIRISTEDVFRKFLQFYKEITKKDLFKQIRDYRRAKLKEMSKTLSEIENEILDKIFLFYKKLNTKNSGVQIKCLEKGCRGYYSILNS